MRPLPFMAQPRFWTLRLMLELGLLGFLFIALDDLISRPPTNLPAAVANLVVGAPAIIYPLWLRSRTLTVTATGVVYRAWFRSTVAIPYQDVRVILIEGKRMQETVGAYGMFYTLRITGARGNKITVAMDNYRVEDLRNIVEQLLAHGGQACAKGLTRGLLDGSHSFSKR